MGSPVFDRRRQAVKDYLQEQFRFGNLENFAADMSAFTLRLIEYGLDACIPALAELLDDADAYVRISAAIWLRIMCVNSLEYSRPEHDRKAVRVLVNTLDRGTVEQKIVTMSYLNARGVGVTKVPSLPVEAIPLLKKLLNSSDERIKLMAAIGLLPEDSGRVRYGCSRYLKPRLRATTPTYLRWQRKRSPA